ncbi:MAG: DUF4860 domain-containing protein [Clostridiales bacterium]|jgi:hypothetical protein|nr:DUF4860 domain-containing protein [Clostridiales bacterium]
MIKPVRNNRIDTIFVLIVFCVFAAAALSSLMFGAGAYRAAVDKSQERYDERTSLFYIWSKVKNADEGGYVRVGAFYGADALIIGDPADEAAVNTYIYYYDGWLRELFGRADWDYSLDDGQRILELADGVLDFETLDSGSIRVSDHSGSIFITPRAAGGVYTDTLEEGAAE